MTRPKALAALAAGDGMGVHDYTKGWIGSGGGAWLPDAWLLYAASGLLLRQPKTAVHSLDLGLEHWITGAMDRAVLTWCRGEVVRLRKVDPKTALDDLEAAANQAPPWLRSDAEASVVACRVAAATSRKRVPSVGPRPDYRPPVEPPNVGRDITDRSDGDRPEVWDLVVAYFR